MIIFRILWVMAVIVALLGAAFFFIGIADGTVSSFNIVLWAAVLAAMLTVPGVLYALFLLVAVTSGCALELTCRTGGS